MYEITKSRAIFFVITPAGAALCAGGEIFLRDFFGFSGIFASVFIVFMIIFTQYFRSISYEISGGVLTAKSGIIFIKTRSIRLSELEMSSVFFAGKTAVVSIIKTPAGASVIFGKFEKIS